jgi:hypothetical protein
MTWVYEEPGSLLVSDWEAFRDMVREDVESYPDRQEAAEALVFAERMLKELRDEQAQRDAA